METHPSTSGAFRIPEELKARPLRKARLTSDGITTRVYAWGLLVFAIAWAVGFSADAARRFQHRTELRSEGKEAIGEITRHWSPGRSSSWKIRYTFAVEGTPFGGEARVPKQLENDLRKGLPDNSPLPIRYLPTDPSVNYPVGWEESSGSILNPLIAAIMLAVFLGMIALGLSLPFRLYRQLIRQGVPTVGAVTKFNPRRGRTGPSICYEFRSEDGRTTSGSSACDGALEIGASVCVLYLPEDPQKNQLYPLPYYRVAQ